MEIKTNNKIIICDIDGCLIETSWIWDINRVLKLGSPLCWELFENNATSSWNKIDSWLLMFLKEKIKKGFSVCFLTSRSEKIKAATILQIEEKTGLRHGTDFEIICRRSDDESEACQHKSDCLDAYFNLNQIELAIDDNKSIIDMYKSRGINAIRWTFGFIPAEIINEFIAISEISLKVEVK